MALKQHLPHHLTLIYGLAQHTDSSSADQEAKGMGEQEALLPPLRSIDLPSSRAPVLPSFEILHRLPLMICLFYERPPLTSLLFCLFIVVLI